MSWRFDTFNEPVNENIFEHLTCPWKKVCTSETLFLVTYICLKRINDKTDFTKVKARHVKQTESIHNIRFSNFLQRCHHEPKLFSTKIEL